jgi:peptide/nickel transport system permease protein
VYLLKRLALIIPTAILSSLLIFVVMSVLPGDVALSILSDTPHTVEMREALRDELGLNDPYTVQFARWMWSMLTGGFGGESLQMQIPIRSIVAQEMPVTIMIALYTVFLSVLVSVPLAVVSATRKNRLADFVVRAASLGGLALPHVWLALILILLLLRVFGWSPPIIYSGLFENPVEHMALLIWPVLLLTWQLSSHLVRSVRTALVEALASVHVLAARARGVPEWKVIWVHALREALIPAITVLALQMGTLLGGSVVLEVIFGIPGIGRRLVDAALARDHPVVQSLAFLFVFAVLVVNVLVDFVYSVADPRVRPGLGAAE